MTSPKARTAAERRAAVEAIKRQAASDFDGEKVRLEAALAAAHRRRDDRIAAAEREAVETALALDAEHARALRAELGPLVSRFVAEPSRTVAGQIGETLRRHAAALLEETGEPLSEKVIGAAFARALGVHETAGSSDFWSAGLTGKSPLDAATRATTLAVEGASGSALEPLFRELEAELDRKARTTQGGTLEVLEAVEGAASASRVQAALSKAEEEREAVLRAKRVAEWKRPPNDDRHGSRIVSGRGLD